MVTSLPTAGPCLFSALIQILLEGGGEAPNYSQLLTHNHTLLVVISSEKNTCGVSA